MYFPDRFMCSEVCPCDAKDKSLWESIYEEDAMKKKLRTYNTVATTPTFALVFITQQQAKVTAENPYGKVFDSFDQCFSTNIANKFDAIPKPFSDESSKHAYEQFSKPSTLKNLRYFENHFECSGMCDVPLFYLTKSTSEGPPHEDCAEQVIHSIKGNITIQIIAFLGMMSFWWACIMTLPNCCKKKKGGNKNEKHVELAEDVTGMDTTRDKTVYK